LVIRFVEALPRLLALGFAIERFTAFFAAAALGALCALAFPAGERLVAGFSRVDLTTRFRALDVLDEELERDDSRFSGLLIGKC
jgi:hypothetical protein